MNNYEKKEEIQIINGLIFKRNRLRYCLTSQQAAKLLGISKGSLLKYERSQTDMPVTVAMKMIILYNIDF